MAKIFEGRGKGLADYSLIICSRRRVVDGTRVIAGLPEMLAALAKRGVNELHVEAGYKLNGSLVREGCVDEFLLYQNEIGRAHV